MSLGMIVYFIGLLDSLDKLLAGCVAIMVAGVVGSIIGATARADCEDHTFLEGLKYFKTKHLLISAFIFGVLAVVVPDRETSYVILAATGVDILANDEGVQRIAGKSMEAFEKQLDEYLKGDSESEPSPE